MNFKCDMSLRIDAQSEPMASCSFPTSPLQGPQSVCIYYYKYTKPMAPAQESSHSQDPWLAAAFLQPLCRDLRAFVFININTQSPWLLRRGLGSYAQSDFSSSASTSTIAR